MTQIEYYTGNPLYSLCEFLLDECGAQGIEFSTIDDFEIYIRQLLNADIDYVKDCLNNKVPVEDSHCDILHNTLGVRQDHVKMFHDKMEFLSLNITPPEVETSIRWRKKMMAMYSDYKYAHLSMDQMCRKYRCNETSIKKYVSYGKMVTEYNELYPDKCDITHIAFFINLGLNNSQLYGMFGKHQDKLKKMRAILDEQNK